MIPAAKELDVPASKSVIHGSEELVKVFPFSPHLSPYLGLLVGESSQNHVEIMTASKVTLNPKP